MDEPVVSGDGLANADALLVKESLSSGRVPPEMFLEKYVLQVQDTNNGSYVNQINFSLDQVTATSQRWISLSEAYISIPLQITMKSSVSLTNADAHDLVNAWICGLKSTHNLLDQVSVEVDGQQVSSQNSFHNVAINWKLLTEMNDNDLKKYGDSLIFSPDGQSVDVQSGASPNGLGETNNVVNPYQFSVGSTWLGGAQNGVNEPNLGYLNRLKNTSYPLIEGKFVGLGSTSAIGGNNSVNTRAIANQLGRNYMSVNALGQAANTVWSWYIIGNIRLSDVCDYFDKCPLVKASRCRISLYINTCDFNNTVDTNNMSVSSYTQRSGRCCPFMLSSGEAYTITLGANTGILSVSPYQPLLATNAVHTWSIGVSNQMTNGQSHPFFTSARIYIPTYTLTPEADSMLTANREREVNFEDFQSFYINAGGGGTPPSGQVQQLLTTGLKNLERLVICPQVNRQSNFQVVPYQSPFDSSPSTTAYNGQVSSFNCLVAGKSIFQQNTLYTFENYLNETSKTGVNNGLTQGVSSGLLSENMFRVNHYYLTVNLGRRLQSDNKTPMSVEVRFINQSSKHMDYIAILFYRRRAVIDLVSGALRIVE